MASGSRGWLSIVSLYEFLEALIDRYLEALTLVVHAISGRTNTV